MKTIVLGYMACLLLAHIPANASELAVSVNGGLPTVRVSSPLLISATMTSAGQVPASWAESLAVTITGEDGEVLPITPALHSATSTGYTGRALWTVAPEAKPALRPGRYLVRVAEASAAFAFSLQGAANDTERERDILLLARWKWVAGGTDEAKREVDAWLASNPSSISAWVLKADLHESAGEYSQALEAIIRAIEAMPESDHAPAVLLRRQSRLLDKE